MDLLGTRFRPIAPLGQTTGVRQLRVFDSDCQADLVLKYAPGEAERSEAARRLAHEFHLLTKLRHPHLVRPRAFGTSGDGSPYLTREWVPGDDLATLLQQGVFPIRRLYAVLHQVLELLAFLHSRLLILRDLNPRTLILSEEGLTLTDLSTAEQYGLVSDGTITGTLAYLAPEIALGGVLDARSDLYSLGCLAYHMAVGVPPFPGTGGLELIRAHLQAVPVPLRQLRPELDASFEAFVNRLLSKDPDGRFATATDALAELATLTHIPVSMGRVMVPMGYLNAIPLVGRGHELESLKQAFVGLRAARGASLFISGEAGFGKSRLVREVQLLAQLEGYACHLGQCTDGMTVSYGPVAEALRPLLEQVPLAGAFEPVSRLFQAHEPPGASSLDPRTEKLQLFQGTESWLRSAALRQPLIVLVEDAHWADHATSELLEYLVPRLQDAPVLFALTYRPDELPPDGPLHRLLNEKLPKLISLRPLLPDECLEMVEGLLGSRAVPAELVVLIETWAGGNPFFISEVLRFLIEERCLEFRDDRWQLSRSIEDIPAPESIEQTMRHRFSRLPEEARRLVMVAAVAGDMLDAGLLTTVGDLPEENLIKALDTLIARQFLRVTRAGLQFHHARMRDAIYEAIPPDQKRVLHGHVGKALQAQQGVPAAVLAHHFSRADRLEEGRRYLDEAARQAVANDSNAEAIDYLSEALRLLEAHGLSVSEEADAIRERIGRLAILTNPVLTVRMFEHVLPQRPALDPITLELQAMMALAYAFSGDQPAALQTIERASRVQPEGTREHAFLLFARGVTYLYLGYLEESEALCRQARETLMDLRPWSTEAAWVAAMATTGVNVARVSRGLLPDAALATQAEVLSEHYQFASVQGIYLHMRLVYGLYTGHYEAFTDAFDLYMRLSRKWGYPVIEECLRLVPLGLMHLERGNAALALTEAERLVVFSERAGAPYYHAWGTAILGRAHCMLGDHAGGVSRLESAVGHAREGQIYPLPELQCFLAEAYMALDRWDEAEALLKDAYRTSSQGRKRNLHQHALSGRLLARCELRRGDRTAARRLLEEGLAQAQAAGNLLIQAHGHHELQHLLAASGDLRDAALHRQLARAFFERVEHPLGKALIEGQERMEQLDPTARSSDLEPLRMALRSLQVRGLLADQLQGLGEKVDQALADAVQTRRLKAIAEFSLVLAGSLQVETVVEFALGRIHELAGAHQTALRFTDVSGEVLIERGFPEGAERFRELLDAVLRHGAPVYLEEPAPHAEQVEGWRPSLVMAFPLHARGRVAGALYVERSPFQTPFTEEDRVILESLATYAGFALDNARLYSRMEGLVAERTHELEDALGKLRTAYAELQQIDEMKANFLSLVSHELRTPITYIKGFASALIEEDVAPVSEEQRPYLEKIIGGSDLLATLIEDLLDYARMEAGKFRIDCQSLDLVATLKDVGAAMAPLVAEKDLRLDLKASEELPLVFADPARVTQILNNLLSNAIKYTPPGGAIVLSATVSDEAVRVEVQDTGIGIPEDALPKIFSNYFRVESQAHAGIKGTGLGLVITKGLVEAHGGVIGIESTFGVGSTVWFTLPPFVG